MAMDGKRVKRGYDTAEQSTLQRFASHVLWTERITAGLCMRLISCRSPPSASGRRTNPAVEQSCIGSTETDPGPHPASDVTMLCNAQQIADKSGDVAFESPAHSMARLSTAGALTCGNSAGLHGVSNEQIVHLISIEPQKTDAHASYALGRGMRSSAASGGRMR
jgi:hypothetical protein